MSDPFNGQIYERLKHVQFSNSKIVSKSLVLNKSNGVLRFKWEKSHFGTPVKQKKSHRVKRPQRLVVHSYRVDKNCYFTSF